MANIKITDLVALTDPATTDVLPVVDIANDETKKVAVGEIVGKISGDVDVATNGASSIASGVIVDADVNAAAAIAGTKIDPDFGSQTVETTGVFSAAGGAEATPSIAFTGDLNTGIYSPGADQVAISTNGTGRLFIDASGNVGVGTATLGSNAKAEIKSTTGSVTSATLRLNSSDTTTGAVDTGSTLLFAGHDGTVSGRDFASIFGAKENSTSGNYASYLAFGTRANGGAVGERLRITSDGKVGLGTSSPGELLDVNGYIKHGSVGFIANGDLGFIYTGTNNNTYGTVIGTKPNTTYSTARDFTVCLNPSLGTGREVFRIAGQSGNVGIGTTSPADVVHIQTNATGRLLIGPNGASNFHNKIYNDNGDLLISSEGGASDMIVGSNRNIKFYTGGVSSSDEAARIDSSGRLLVGTSTARTNFGGGTESYRMQHEGDSANGSGFSLVRNSNNSGAPSITFGKTRSTGNTIVQNNDVIGALYFEGNDGTNFFRGASIEAEIDGTPGANDMPGRLVFSTTADGSATPTERMRIDSNGLITTTGSNIQGDEIFQAQGGTVAALRVFKVNSVGNNTGAAATWIRKNSSTDRSINAAGTINASGADYAEYMTKAGDFTIAKGDICGINSNGKLTNVFANAVGFVVKSTDPSYVGSDSWGADIEDPVQLETERQKVDRIAFAGQVPVNVMDASPGQYIVPVLTTQGGITGIAKDEADLTLADYMRAVGKVIAIEDDGRARIIVKVA